MPGAVGFLVHTKLRRAPERRFQCLGLYRRLRDDGTMMLREAAAMGATCEGAGD